MTLRNKSFTNPWRGNKKSFSFSEFFSTFISTRITLQQKLEGEVCTKQIEGWKNCSLIYYKENVTGLLIVNHQRLIGKKSLIYWFVHKNYFHQANGFCVGPVFCDCFYGIVAVEKWNILVRGNHSIFSGNSSTLIFY